jgi:hypothetical protein
LRPLRRHLAALCLLLAGAAQASTSARLCGSQATRSATQQDRVLQVAQLLRETLAAQGQPAALLARAGTNLKRFGVRYTHAAVSLQNNPLAPFAVRQLYFDCDEGRSRVFDQGLSGFLLGADDPERGFVSLLLLPPDAAQALAQTALSDDTARALLAGQYVANAHPADLLRQNCNQWLAELLALAWGEAASATREQAQAQLANWHYHPEPVRYRWAFWRWATVLVPWFSFQGHPPEDAARNELFTSLPPDLERLAQQRWQGTQRLELCYTPEHAVLRRNGAPLSEACEAGAGDQVRRFD